MPANQRDFSKIYVRYVSKLEQEVRLSSGEKCDDININSSLLQSSDHVYIPECEARAVICVTAEEDKSL